MLLMKEELLKQLYNRQGQPVSGEALGALLGVSRNYIWKLVEQLKTEGVDLRSIPQRGYLLPKEHAALLPFEIADHAKGRYTIRLVPSVDSTNRQMKEWAEQGAPEGTVLFAEEQTAGCGRRRRPFFSPRGSGLYFSVLLRPQSGMADALKITVAAAVAVARGAQEVLGLDLKIKWVNDLYFQNKKVCGILSEGAVDLEGGGLSYCVLGIGLNVYAPAAGFGALSPIAGALLEGAPSGAVRAKLAAAILDHFFALYQDLRDPGMMEEYKSRSFLQGKGLTVVRGTERICGTVIGISDRGELQLRLADGSTRAFSSGEILLEDYR